MKSQDLDETLGTPARLAIVATLAQGQQLTFTALGEQTGIADGNLHVQTKKLIAAGYLTREPVKQGGRTATRFELTERGRLAFSEHVRRLQEAAEGPIDRKARTTAEARPSRRSDPSRVW